MNNVLVTGGAGFIGSNFIRYLFSNEPLAKIVNLDFLTYAGSLENLKGLQETSRYEFVQGDICDRTLVDGLFRDYSIDTVVHFAAETHVDRSITGPGQFIQTNVVGTYTLIESARQYWQNSGTSMSGKPHFHHISTDEVYGSLAPGDPSFSELTPYSPNSPYSASKAASDHLVRAYHHTYGFPITITNCSNNYGPYQFPEKLIPLIILNAVEGKPLPVYGDGKQIRDWLYVEDHCEAIWKVIQIGEIGETYVIGGNNQPTNIEIIEYICDLLDNKLKDSPHKPHRSLIQFVKDRPGHDRRYSINIDKIRNNLNWKPRFTLESGLEKTINWYLDNMEWIQAIRQQNTYQSWVSQNYNNRK